MRGTVFRMLQDRASGDCAKEQGRALSYQLVASHGPDHNKVFEVEVYLNSNPIARGQGKSKKEAEQQAARAALRLMGEDE